jgi:hypothetical protein
MLGRIGEPIVKLASHQKERTEEHQKTRSRSKRVGHHHPTNPTFGRRCRSGLAWHRHDGLTAEGEPSE